MDFPSEYSDLVIQSTLPFHAAYRVPKLILVVFRDSKNTHFEAIYDEEISKSTKQILKMSPSFAIGTMSVSVFFAWLISRWEAQRDSRRSTKNPYLRFEDGDDSTPRCYNKVYICTFLQAWELETLTCLIVWWRSKLRGRSVHQLQSHEVSALIPISAATKAERDAEKRKSMKLTDEDMTEIEKILATMPCSA